ncbi:MAG TPA: hypothetical protein PLU36_01055 [Chitinophagaceae bacterium]|nr:hypothetical protein [Chitinophagaceae bacterium]MCC6635090.1 hypothetical protein [Chitinophagaceae bacterium]HMZ45367.1 hypothetical protein [Chitinophagaceae bacterium]HNE93642.1 hypothetical protein [Chitinophagaceae bacterium]HNF29289.1 hypothetical protein [Chitinophagaceae bacterium]
MYKYLTFTILTSVLCITASAGEFNPKPNKSIANKNVTATIQTTKKPLGFIKKTNTLAALKLNYQEVVKVKIDSNTVVEYVPIFVEKKIKIKRNS